MKRMYIVCYDIADDRRLRQVAHTMESYGLRIQYSVFRCELTKMNRTKLEASLVKIINHDNDQVLFIDLGAVPGSGDDCIKALGLPYRGADRGAIVL